MLPRDPDMLVSYLNTKLRDEYASLPRLFDDLDEDPEEILRTVSAAGYAYDSEKNQFRPAAVKKSASQKPVAVDDFCRLKFLSQVRFSPKGSSACFVASEIDRRKDKYRSFLYLLRGGKAEKLTAFGKESSFIYLDEDTLLFPGKREEAADKELPDVSSRFYKLSLKGGEAQLFLTLPIPAFRPTPLANGDLLLLGDTFPGFEDLYEGKPKRLAAWQKFAKENRDYEILEQVPWWWNGHGFTKGAYNSLFRYSAASGKLQRLTPPGENVQDYKLSPDAESVFFLSTPVRPLLPIAGAGELKQLRLTDGSVKLLAKSREDFELADFAPADSFLLVLASDVKHGLNSDPDFYKLDYESSELKLCARFGESIGSSVGADIRYGGGRSLIMQGDVCWFISTRFDGAGLYKLENGRIEAVTNRPGSVDCFDICGKKILMTGLFDMKAQELYDEKGRQLTHFNQAALRGKYVAQPKPLNVLRDGYEVHGFVLEPKDYDPGKKYPVILDIHGGPKTVYGQVFFHEMQYWAGRGYFVIFCNPTGSDGRGAFSDLRGKYGTVDYEDLMAFTDAALAAYPAMDKKNLFETGGSYGGFMTNWIIGHTDRFKACASQRSISNWFSMYGVSDIGVGFTEDQALSSPWQDPEKLWFHSPLQYADRAKTPTLFIHSFEDYRCPIDQGYQMYTALIKHGVEARLVAFRGENHELSRSGKPSHRLKRLNEITEWFEKHRS
jgi:dipeptidyl aminopeptidase/acylaminoacyl peptidase